MENDTHWRVINNNSIEIGSPVGTQKNPHFLALHLIAILELGRSSARGELVDSDLDIANLTLEYCVRHGRVVDVLP